ncbi:MAG: CPBP family intramembrane metalloprotease, partial [Bacteroidales bacterium]
DGKYRLRLTVSGDKLTAVNHYVKIPEEFYLRYSEMRSRNDTIASFGSIGLIVIYGIGGVTGLFFLLRRRRIIWKKAVIWGFLIALGSVFLVPLNDLPLSWFGYNTSTSASTFIGNLVLAGLLGAVGLGAVFSITFIAAEGMDREAFPNHVQLWKAWGNRSGGSLSLLGQTSAGYLFAAVIVGIDVLFYVVTKRFGWWSPAGNLSDPNILASHVPWFNSISISLQAGFWEEALCRAIPLAGIVIITRKSKYRNFWIILVLLLQTVIFGAGHANYPQQPSYARVLEMIIPFAVIGLIYLGYGLIPVIIAHFAVDVFWFSLPLWAAGSPGIWIDRIMVLLFLFIPLWLVLYYLVKNKKWTNLPDELRNGAWRPKLAGKEKAPAKIPIKPESRTFIQALIPAGIAGIALWIIFTPFTSDAPDLRVSREDAIEIAVTALEEEFEINPEEWRILTGITDQVSLQHRFIWLEGGRDNYEEYLGTFLNPPSWLVRLVKTTGEVEERTEEYSSVVDVEGNVLNVYHRIPEKREGAVLEQEEAQSLTDSVLLDIFKMERNDLKEISVTPEQLENRRNWTFVYADTLNYTLDQGQGRYRVSIHGDEVVSYASFVHIPEEWERNYNDLQSRRNIIRTVGTVFPIAVVILGIILGIIRWTRKRFSIRLFLFFSIGLFLLFILNSYLSWHTLMYDYQTSLPLRNFITMLIISLFIGAIFSSAGLGIIGGMSANLVQPLVTDKYNRLRAIGLGILLMGLLAIFSRFEVKSAPFWGSYQAANSIIPILDTGIGDIQKLIAITGFLYVICFGLHTFTKGWSESRIPFGILTVLTGIVLQASSLENYLFWLVSGLFLGLMMLGIYILYIRYHFEWIPVIAAVFIIFGILEDIIISSVPSATGGGILGILFAGLLSWWWYSGIVTQPRTE